MYVCVCVCVVSTALTENLIKKLTDQTSHKELSPLDKTAASKPKIIVLYWVELKNKQNKQKMLKLHLGLYKGRPPDVTG